MSFWDFLRPSLKVAPSGSLPLAAVLNHAQAACLQMMESRQGYNVLAFYVQNTNSMLPLYDSNAVLLLEYVPFASLRIGDVVTYYKNPRAWGGQTGLVGHRLVRRVGANWQAKGDNVSVDDPELVTPENLDRRVCGVFYAAKDATTDK